MHHRQRHDWLFTPAGEPRGYIQPEGLRELWFHTGSLCNLRCPFCLEGSQPGDQRIQTLSLAEAEPFLAEALGLGVEQFSFTGGEPFVNRDMVAILDRALRERPCLVLTNGTEPLANRLADLLSLQEHPHPLRLRVSLDYPDPERHDAGRGPGNFRLALRTLGQLHRHGFAVSVARQESPGENSAAVDAAFRPFFQEVGLPTDMHIVSFPDFLPPGVAKQVPHVTEHCMTTYKDAAGRAAFMCHYSKMVVKKGGRVGVYACTLVDDDDDYRLADTLTEAMAVRVMLKHHRCYACFACGASCSEPETKATAAQDSPAA